MASSRSKFSRSIRNRDAWNQVDDYSRKVNHEPQSAEISEETITRIRRENLRRLKEQKGELV